MFEQVAGALRAKLTGGGGAWQGNETTHQTTRQPSRWRRCGGPWPRCPWAAAGPGRASRRCAAPISTPGTTGVEGAGGSGGPGCGARGRWRGLAGLRGDAPSEARGADGSRAGRRPRAHKAARPSRAHRAARPSRAHRAARPSRQPGAPKGAGTEVPAPLSAHSATASSRLRPNDPQSWRRRRIHRNMPPTTAAPRPAPPIRPSKPVRARPFFGLVAWTSGAT